MTIRADGVPRLLATLTNAAQQLADIADSHAAAGRIVAAEAARRARRDTGRLIRSITPAVTPNGPAVTAAVNYAALVEARYPFLAPAFAAAEPAVTDVYAAAVQHAADTVKGD